MSKTKSETEAKAAEATTTVKAAEGAKKRKVLVKVPNLDGQPYYRRAGFWFAEGEQVVEVTADELAILRKDSRLMVGEPPRPESEGAKE